MSQSNEPGEENERNDPVGEEFQFYFPFAKTLALELSTPEDKSIAAAWVQKLEAEPESEEEKQTRLNYLKLLLFVMQRGRLSGIFKKQPPSGGLQPFPQGLSIMDMGNMILDQDDSPSCGQGDARNVPYSIELSNDLREFVASQEIPNFGVQMYYAWSTDEPIQKWLSFNENNFPQFVLDKIKQLKEIRSDERTSKAGGSCITVKKGCDISILDKSLRKKVKTPQEIEKSQGRSYHAYMGLVGRMGNFDKCSEDQDKCPRSEPRMGRSGQRESPRVCPGSGGEAPIMMADDGCEEHDSIPNPSQGGMNRCCCSASNANSSQRWRNAQLPPKGGSQSCDAQVMANKSNACNTPYDPEPPYCNSSGSKRPQRQTNEEQCPENDMAQQMQRQGQVQRRTPSPRMRSNTGNRVEIDCPPPDIGEGCGNMENICICSSPPCSCTCPRSQGQSQTRRSPSSARMIRGGGKSPSVSVLNQSGRNKCSPAPEQENCPGSGGRSNEGKKLPLILHCYSENNPDPALLQVIGKLNSSLWSGEDSAYQLQGKTCQGQVKPQTSPAIGQRTRSPLPTRARSSSPEACPRQCEPPQESNHPCRSLNTQKIAQDYLEYDDLPPNRSKHPEVYRKPVSAPAKGSQPMHRPKPYYAAIKQVAPPNADCMPNMANAIQGIRQKAEVHREKCDSQSPRKQSPKEVSYCQGRCEPSPNVCPDPGLLDGPVYSEKRCSKSSRCPDGGSFVKQQMKCQNHMSEPAYNDPCGSQMQQQFGRQQMQSPCPLPSREDQECDLNDELGGNEESTDSEEDDCLKEPDPCYDIPVPSPKQKLGIPRIMIEDTQGNCQSYRSSVCGGGKPNPCSNDWGGKQMAKSMGRINQHENCSPSRCMSSERRVWSEPRPVRRCSGATGEIDGKEGERDSWNCGRLSLPVGGGGRKTGMCDAAGGRVKTRPKQSKESFIAEKLPGKPICEDPSMYRNQTSMQSPLERCDPNSSGNQRISQGCKQKNSKTALSQSQDFQQSRLRRTSPTVAFKSQNYGQAECCNQTQQHNYSAHECPPPAQNYPQNRRRNVYEERSFNYWADPESRGKASSPRQWMGSVSNDHFPSLSEIRSCNDELDEQIQDDMCDPEESMEFVQLNSQNCSKFFKDEDYQQGTDWSVMASYDSNDLDQRPSRQSFADCENYDECDNVENGNYC